MALAEQVEGRALSNLTRIDVLDMDGETTRDEIIRTLSEQLSVRVEDSQIKSLRPAHDGCQRATLCLPSVVAESILKAGNLKIGFSVFRIHKNTSTVRCYRCLAFGHVAARSSDTVHKTNWCLRCGGKDHKAKECSLCDQQSSCGR
ncbi:uncharacterized protein [Drosophila tropicalis]|uniref:uncharacterized protein n=1 Tax=Drosophila tropicalis TaxID=46794 RepID=UPI0035ABD031